MQHRKSFILIASLALVLSACSTNDMSSTNEVQIDRVGTVSQSNALTGCGGIWSWFSSSDCDDAADDSSAERDRCIGLTNAPGVEFEGAGRWDAEKRVCVNKWPSPICYGWLMNRCEDTGTDATHQCSAWNPVCHVMCSKWNGMRFGGYCSADWWAANP